ncbi:MAG: Gfo/Idh/MocA family oxidoreductase [Nitrospirae bacterium]|nr:Gfo/Idh/MocA family oxidoreductase [Nitrospirota bacterium]
MNPHRRTDRRPRSEAERGKVVRVGLVGAGTWGANHLEKLRQLPDVQLVGIRDTDETRARELCARFRLAALEQGPLTAKSLDAVVVATPTAAHHGVAAECLRNGIHVFVEKPMAATPEEAEELVDLARKAGCVCQVGHIERFNPAWRNVEPKLNRPMYVEGQRLAPFRERGTDVDVVLDLMIHDVDLVLAAAGAEPVRVDAVGVPVLSREVDMVNVRLEFKSGMVCNLTASRVSPETVRKLRLFQRDGYFSVDLLTGSVRLCNLGPDAEEKRIYEMKESVEGSDPLRSELEEFLAAIRENRPPKVTAEDGLRSLRVAIRIKEKVGEFMKRLV